MVIQRINEKRVYREIAFPVSAFDVLQDLKRKWGLRTNGEVLTRVLLTSGKALLMENAEDAGYRNLLRISPKLYSRFTPSRTAISFQVGQ